MMLPSALNARVIEAALAFCWDSWGQMGVAHATAVVDRRAADPEALIVFTLAVARNDPRLFDELLDWLRENERLISVRRLRNLAGDPEVQSLVDASLEWIARFRANPRFASTARDPMPEAVPLFSGGAADGARSDHAFLARGFARGKAEASFKSRPPDLSRPINLAFRLRLALGVGSRAEVIRHLLTMPEPDASVQAIASGAAFAKRNVAETLDGLVASGLVQARPVTNERLYSLDRAAWARLLGLDARSLPRQVQWPALLGAIRRITRAVSDPALDDLSPYMRSSVARDVLEMVERDLRVARVSIEANGRVGDDFWDGFRATVEGAMAALAAPR